MAVEPVEPTNARTLSREDTVIATAYDETRINAVKRAKRGSLSTVRPCCGRRGDGIGEGPNFAGVRI